MAMIALNFFTGSPALSLFHHPWWQLNVSKNNWNAKDDVTLWQRFLTFFYLNTPFGHA